MKKQSEAYDYMKDLSMKVGVALQPLGMDPDTDPVCLAFVMLGIAISGCRETGAPIETIIDMVNEYYEYNPAWNGQHGNA
jgi:hypothetical protein